MEKTCNTDILVIRCPYMIRRDVLKKRYEEFLKQKEQGLIIIPSGFYVEFIPKDCNITFIYEEKES